MLFESFLLNVEPMFHDRGIFLTESDTQRREKSSEPTAAELR